ncbi:MAG: hypothetical protein IJ073_03315 [Lachnospiraceae bacterium]|nr:hypothetical protein [Lachnospiraceae bacterium]
MIKKYYPYIILAAGFAVLFFRAFYSFCWSDESFYFSTAWRFYQGDSIFRHDWFPTQLSGVILLPFLSLYLAFSHGSAEGLLLYFRLLYLLFSFGSSVAAFRILKKHFGELPALASALCVLFYAHLNIATLSYYTISVQCFFLAQLNIYHWEKLGQLNRRVSLRYLILAGFFYALSVLALPTMVVGYVLTLLIFVILSLVSKINPSTAFSAGVRKAELFVVWKYTFFGILLPAVLFFVFLLTNVSIPDFIQNIPYVLTDEEHGTSLVYPMKKFFIGINEVYGRFAHLGYLLILICFGIAVYQALRSNSRLILFVIDILLFIAYFIKGFGHTGYIQTALCLTALPLFFLTRERDYAAFFTFFVNGLVFSLVYSYSSNGYLYILAMGHFIASIAGIKFIVDFVKENLEAPALSSGLAQAVRTLCVLVLLSVTLETMVLRVINIYRDAPFSELTEKIEEGPAKGLYTTKKHLDLYKEVYDTLITDCQSDTADSIFISKLLPWGYLCTDLRVGAPTTWRTELGSERLREYYELNPDRIPDLVLVLNEEYGTYDTCGDVEADPNPNAQEKPEGFLTEYMAENDYKVRQVSCGTLYINPGKN